MEPDTTRSGCLLWAQGSGETITQKKTALTPKTQICGGQTLLSGAARSWHQGVVELLSDETTSTLMSRTKMAKDHSSGLLTMDTRERQDYFLNGGGHPSQAKSGPPNTTRLCYCKGPCRSCSSATASSTCHLQNGLSRRTAALLSASEYLTNSLCAIPARILAAP